MSRSQPRAGAAANGPEGRLAPPRRGTRSPAALANEIRERARALDMDPVDYLEKALEIEKFISEAILDGDLLLKLWDGTKVPLKVPKPWRGGRGK